MSVVPAPAPAAPDGSLPASDSSAASVPSALRLVSATLAPAVAAFVLLRVFPAVELAIFARGAAALASVFLGTSVEPIATGWLLPSAGLPVAVTGACSATDLYLMVVALLGWRLAHCGRPSGFAPLAAPCAALPFTLLVNGLRIVAVAQAHRWFIPLFPDAYGAFLHLLVGAFVFLPSLIALNFLLEYHARLRPALRA